MTERTLTIIRDDKHCSAMCPWLYGRTCLLFREEDDTHYQSRPQHLFKNGDIHTPCEDCDTAMANLELFDKRVLP